MKHLEANRVYGLDELMNAMDSTLTCGIDFNWSAKAELLTVLSFISASNVDKKPIKVDVTCSYPEYVNITTMDAEIDFFTISVDGESGGYSLLLNPNEGKVLIICVCNLDGYIAPHLRTYTDEWLPVNQIKYYLEGFNEMITSERLGLKPF